MSSAAPKSFAALRLPRYRAFFLGAALLMTADSIEHAITYWVMYEKFRSPALAGFAMISHWLPFLLFSVWSGALADRYDPRRLIQIGLGLFMLASLAWGLLLLTNSLQMWHAAALLVVHGLAGVMWSPAAQVLIHDIVEDDLLHSAIRLSATARWLGMLLGPALGGGILLLLGPAWGLLFNVLVYLPFFVWLQKTQIQKKQLPESRRIRGFADIVATIREIAGNRVIISMTLLAGTASLFVGNAYQPQIPEFASHLGHSEGGATYAALLAADAAGALTAGLLLESRGLLKATPRTSFILAMFWCLALGSFALSTSYLLALTLLFAAGFLELSFNAMAQTLAQMAAPAHSRGRVIGLFIMASLGLRAFAGVTIGIGGSQIGIHWSLALSTMAVLAAITTLLAFTMRSRA